MSCQHFGVCGGCKLQHLSYEEQLMEKELFVKELFGQARSIVGCKSAWRWRNKMEFTFTQNREGERFLGLMMRGRKGRAVHLKECLLVSDWFIHTLENVYHWWEESSLSAYFPPANRGELRTLMLREGAKTKERMALLTVSGDAPIVGFASAIEADSILLRRQYSQKGSSTYFTEELLQGKGYIREKLFDFTLTLRPSAFFQPNTYQAEVIYDLALAEVQGGLWLDLYCGIGCIGMKAAERAEKVIGIEICPDAVASARENLAQNGLGNMEIREGDVEKLLAGIGEVDGIICDPPRGGLSKKSLQELLRIGAQKIIYISCNPVSQKKNIEEMEGYEIAWVQPVDQFPHTTHVENIVCLRKNL